MHTGNSRNIVDALDRFARRKDRDLRLTLVNQKEQLPI
jgi:hypothetical protein